MEIVFTIMSTIMRHVFFASSEFDKSFELNSEVHQKLTELSGLHVDSVELFNELVSFDEASSCLVC